MNPFDSATSKPNIQGRKTLTELMPIGLRYTGKGSELTYEVEFTREHGMSLGRLGILLHLLQHYGPQRARDADDATLEHFFNQEIQDDLRRYGLNEGSILGLTGDSGSHGLTAGRIVMLDERRGGRPRLSAHGLAAFRDVAAHYGDPGEPPALEPAAHDMDTLRNDLEQLRDQLSTIERRFTARGDGPAPIGHNNPPEDLLLGAALTDVSAALDDIPTAIASTESEETVRSADPSMLKKLAGHLNSISRGVARWFASGGAQVGKGIAQGMGKEAWENPAAFVRKLETVAHMLTHWASTLFG